MSTSPKTRSCRPRATESVTAPGAATVLAYEARLKALHFDPGPVDGYFDQATQYAVSTVQKYFNLPRTGVINTAVDFALTHFTYSPAEPASEPDRVEIDLDRQTLTVYTNWQPQLLTTTSTGSGEHFCGGVDGCQYAITPTGHFHFYELHKGWQNGKLGNMWNPFYFNGSDAVHGLASVPELPGVARVRPHPDAHRELLLHAGAPGRVGVRRRHREETRQRVRRPGPDDGAETHHHHDGRQDHHHGQEAHHADHQEGDGHDGQVGVEAAGNNDDHETPLTRATSGRHHAAVREPAPGGSVRFRRAGRRKGWWRWSGRRTGRLPRAVGPR